MKQGRALEQHIAVFGESGSGKTVLLSSFYGAAQEPDNIKSSRFNVVAENPTQGTQLSQNYLGMKKSAKLPAATHLSATSYSFLIKLKDGSGAKGTAHDALRLVWHDYPGEWFEQDVSGPEEAQRRVDTFRALLGSDVALLLVDGQRLLENSGEEERYLKSLLTNYRSQLLLLKHELLVDDKPLVRFPRIWIMALSKSDLLPSLNATGFRELLQEKVGGEINELHDTISAMVEGSDALSVGEDFVRLSSATFSTEKIEVTKRVGINLILPLAAVLPFERHLHWAETMKVPRKVAVELMVVVEGLAVAVGAVGLIGARLIGSTNKPLSALGVLISRFGPDAAKLVKDKLVQANAVALAKQNNLTATLAEFQNDLEKGESEQILLTSDR
jgi:hypothetical protein